MRITDNQTLVLYAPIGEGSIGDDIYPRARRDEIARCKSEKVKREKYFAWKLLRKALTDYFNLDFDNLQFAKTANGQWICPDVFFSISHSDGAVCVAASSFPVGVDIEKRKGVNPSLAARILTEREYGVYEGLKETEKEEFLLESWVKKESIFKRRGASALMPGSLDTLGDEARLSRVVIKDEKYVIAVASEQNETVILYMEEI